MDQKKKDEEFEKVIAIGEGSVSQVQSIFKTEEAESKKKRDTVLDFLSTKRHVLDYNFLVADLLIKRLRLNEWGSWTFKVAPTKEGVVMEVKSPDNRTFRQAFKTDRSPYDLTAIDIFAMRAQNTVDGPSSINPKNNRG